jgi:hypothetical protein
MSVCTDPLMPGINKTTYPADVASAAIGFAENEADAPSTTTEPPLKCYVTASCLESRAAVEGKARKCKKQKRHRAAEAGKRRHCKHKKKRH